jgi:hypothetical protein
MSIADSIRSDHDGFRSMIETLQRTSTEDLEERRRTFSEIRQKTSAHFLAEEDTVIKEMTKVTELRPFALELMEEHQAIRDLLDVLWATNCNDPVWLPRFAPIAELLSIHMGKEENIAIPAAPRYFTDAQLEALGNVFVKTGAREMGRRMIRA